MPIRYIAFMAILITLPVFAQETMTGSTQTGSSLSSEDDLIWAERESKTTGFRISMLETRKEDEAFALFVQNYRNNQIENAKNCNTSLRKANKLTLFSTKLRCYRNNILLEQNYLERQKQHIENMAGVSKDLKTNTINLINNLIDAIYAIRDGIDNDVYRNMDDILEAKLNLHSMYRIPVLNAILHSVAQRNDTWTTHLLVRLHTFIKEKEYSNENKLILEEIVNCLSNNSEEWREIEDMQNYEDSFTKWESTRNANKQCILQLKEANELL